MPAGEDLLRRTYDALNRRDLAVLAELADPELEMDLTERVLNPATYRGAEGMLRFLGRSTISGRRCRSRSSGSSSAATSCSRC
jgi:ketosteroid isomerase-like protein